MQAIESASPATKAEGTGSARSAAPLVEALQCFYRAFQKSSIYPSGHPSIPAAIEQALRSLEEVLSGQGNVLVRVTRDHLIHGSEKLSESTGALRSLAQLLHQLDLAAVEFRTGLTTSDMERLAQFLGRARRDRIRGARLVQEFGREPMPHVHLCPIDYRALRFSEGRHKEDGGEGHAGKDLWENLTRLLTDPAAYAEEGAIPRLANELEQQIERREGAGIGALRKKLHRTLNKLHGMQSDQRDVVRNRLTGFVAGLNTGLRRDLLRVDPAGPRPSLNLLNELAEELPLPDLLEALQDIDRGGGRVPDEMLVLLNKLVRISEKRHERAPLLLETLSRWGVAPPAVTNPPDTRQALQEVLQSRSDTDFNPHSYQTLLTQLSRRNLSGVAQASALRYRDPADSADVRVHAAEIAVHLLGRADGEAYRSSLLAYVDAATKLLLERQRFDTVLEATHAARAHSVLKTDSDDTHRAARCFLQEFTREERIEQILAHATREGRVPEEALGLLELGGPKALDLVLDLLTGEPPPGVAAPLRRFARQRGAQQLDRLLDQRADRGGVALEPVFGILRELPTADAVSLLEKLSRHANLRVRCQVVSLLCEMDPKPGAPEQHLRRALGDPDRRLVDLAIRRLSELDTQESLDLLGQFIEGSLRGAVRRQDSCRRAVRALLRRGDPGIERLCRSHMALMRSLRARDARLARMLVARLERERAHPAVRRCMRHWRFSLNRLIGLLLPASDVRRAERRK